MKAQLKITVKNCSNNADEEFLRRIKITRGKQNNDLLGEEKLAWLKKTLEQESDREAVIFMHHHPLPSGCLHMDTIRCLDFESLRDNSFSWRSNY